MKLNDAQEWVTGTLQLSAHAGLRSFTGVEFSSAAALGDCIGAAFLRTVGELWPNAVESRHVARWCGVNGVGRRRRLLNQECEPYGGCIGVDMCRHAVRNYAASGRASRGLAEPTQQAWPGGMVP